MSIEKALRAHLISFSSVLTRIYPLKLSQNPTLPAITYQKITGIINYLRNGGTKLELVQMVDRGAMTPNEWRAVLNLGPVEGGDKPIR